MQIKIIDNYQDFLNLEDSWNTLFEKISEDRVHLSFEWFRCWWEAFGKNRKLFTFVITDNNEVIFIAPLCITEDKLRGLKAKKISFMANGIAPSCDFISENLNEELLNLLIEKIFSLSDFWDVLEFQLIFRNSITYKLLTRILQKRNYGITDSIKSPYIEINGTWDNFLSNKSPKFRKALRNKINRADKSGDIKTERVNNKEDLNKALQDVFYVSSRSWKEKQGTSITSSLATKTFYQKITENMGNKGCIEIWVMKKGGEPIAIEYHLKFKGTVYPIRADFDEDYRNLSPGSVLEYSILKDIFTNKTAKVYDTCGHTYKYLLNWSDELREYYNFQVFNSRINSHLLYSLQYKCIPLLRKIGIKKYWRQ